MTNEHTHHVVPLRIYVLVFLALMVGTAVTVWVAGKNLGPLNIIVALTIAVTKATLVVLYFMHLRYTHRLNWIFMSAAVLWLALLLAVVMADVKARDTESPARPSAVSQVSPK